ncbi:TAFII55 protein conserved region-domain-containing protein [Lentinula detonsa]|uniref:TAFII55 protein conserved region-domain-containing protein n=1 Tax=Lentinula detonsa TaxID=2804962 RepID=A0A9W8P0T7_9AGAR|nr:TAFII55 protein conserved region-domain-containing protein [Lentinula detonsa]
MYDDLIIIDDEEPQAGPSYINGSSDADPPTTPIASTSNPSAISGSRTSSRLRASSHAQQHAPPESSFASPAPTTESKNSNISTRSGAQRPKTQPKLKLKLSEKLAAQAPGMSFLGQYDRELDSDDNEDLAFEEQFILRLPPGDDCDRLRKSVAAREVPGDVWFKFKDSRRGVFHIGNNTYASKLVDMPCIIESQKTLDNKQMFKVADICQMLVVEDRIDNEDVVTREKSLNIDDFIWPHGITPPLAHVRKRRFRKRINKRTIETVEQEVERLLEQDNLAKEIKYDILENVNPDLSDSEFIEREEPIDAPTPAISDTGDPATPGGILGDEGEDEDEGDDEPDGDIDEELAAELDLALGDEDDDGDDDDDDDDSDDDDDDDDDDDEVSQARKLLNEEIRDLQAAVAKKGSEIASSANPLIRKRFEDALKKLTSDLEMKLAQRDEMQEKQRMEDEGIVVDNIRGGGDSDSEVEVDGVGIGVGSAQLRGDEDLFGGEDAVMDLNQIGT